MISCGLCREGADLAELQRFAAAGSALPYEICENRIFLFRKTVGFTAEADALDQKCHISSERTHGLQTFTILTDFLRGVSVNHIPVLAGYDGHLGDCKIFVQLIKSCSVAASPAAHDGCAYFHTFVCSCTVKQTVHKRYQSSVGRGEVYGRADDDSVAVAEFWSDLVHQIIENAFSGSLTFAAADAPADRPVSDMDDFRVNAFLIQSSGNLVQRGVGTSVFVGTSVDQENLGVSGFFFLSCL